MHPVLLAFGPVRIYSYGLMVAFGVLTAVYLLRRNAKALGVNRDVVLDLALLTVFSGFVGARLFYVASYWSYFRDVPLEIIQIWKGGVVLYGGVIGSLIAFYVFVKYKRLPFLSLLDLFVPAIALAQGFGRIGCFLNGCCYGVKTTVPWAIRLPFLPDPIHPTQLYESLFCFVLAGFLFFLWQKRLRPGIVSASYFLLYAIGRFFLEFVRGDNTHVFAGFTLPQLMSLMFILLSCAAFVAIRRYGHSRVHRTR